MLVNFDRNMTSIDGTDILENEKPVPMKGIVCNALLVNDQAMTPDDKCVYADMATKIYAGGDVELSAEDLTKIKAAVGKYFPPLVVSQVFKYIEGLGKPPSDG